MNIKKFQWLAGGSWFIFKLEYVFKYDWIAIRISLDKLNKNIIR